MTHAGDSEFSAVNLGRIKERLRKAAGSPELATIIPSDVQGIFIRRLENTLELYCYEPATRKLSDIMFRIDLDNPLHLIGTYGQVMMLAAIWSPSPPKRIYVAGFGGGRLTMPIHHIFPQCLIDGSDFDPAILKAAEAYFAVEFDERHDVRVNDSAVDLVQRQGTYDIIHVDVFSNSGDHPGHLASVEFFRNCAHKLGIHGVLAINLVDHDPGLERKTQNLLQVFESVVECRTNGASILFASHQRPDLNALIQRAADFEKTAELTYPLSSHAKILRQLERQNKVVEFSA